MYPGGTVSVAVHIVPVVVVNPFTVKTAGLASDASNGDVTTDPDVHARLTDTLAELWGENSLRTVNVFEFSVLVMVHVPAMAALQVPGLASPTGTWIFGRGAGRARFAYPLLREVRRSKLRRRPTARITSPEVHAKPTDTFDCFVGEVLHHRELRRLERVGDRASPDTERRAAGSGPRSTIARGIPGRDRLCPPCTSCLPASRNPDTVTLSGRRPLRHRSVGLPDTMPDEHDTQIGTFAELSLARVLAHRELPRCCACVP